MDVKTMTLGEFKDAPRSALKPLADEIRQFLISAISETGGHIGANLGTIELSIALHYAFTSPDDTFIFDTGHTGYTHKILTGRIDKFKTLNTYGGMNRFVSRFASEHDIIEASHAGTSISVAMGRALSMRLNGLPHWSLAFIVVGSLSECLALDAWGRAAGGGGGRGGGGGGGGGGAGGPGGAGRAAGGGGGGGRAARGGRGRRS